MSWQKDEYDKTMMSLDINYSKIGQKWGPILENNFSEEVHKILLKDLALFCEVYQCVDQSRPELPTLPPLPPPSLMGMKQPNLYEPEGWYDLPSAVKEINDRLEDFLESNINVNFEIVKEYYNPLKKAHTYLLKDKYGDDMVLSTELKKRLDDRLKLELDDVILFILDPSERLRLNRKRKIDRLLSEE